MENTNLKNSEDFKAVLTGIKSAFPIAFGYLPLGFAFGVLAVKSGIPALFAIIMSISVYAGSGQFIAASMVGIGSPVISIVIANFLINLRYVLMVSSLLNYVRNLSFFQKILFSTEITDESFAVHYVHSQQGEIKSRFDKIKLFSLNITAHSGWVFGSLLGVLSGGFMADIKPFGLDYALPAMFIALLVPLCFERLQLIVALIAGILLLLCVMTGLGQYGLVIASIVAASIGVYLEIRKEKQNNRT